MKDFIAVISAKLLLVPRQAQSVLAPEPVKRTALLFDRIAVPEFKLGWSVAYDVKSEFGPEYINDLDWLYQAGILFEPKINLSEDALQDELLLSDFAAARKSSEEFIEALSVTPDRYGEEFRNYAFSYARRHGTLVSRYTAALLRKKYSWDAFPLSSMPDSNDLIRSGKSEVIQVLFKNIPVPDENVSWEQIVEYRNDPDSKEKFFRLRHWMIDISKQQLKANEIEERLEWLLHDYERHLRVHRLKIYPGCLETFITTGAELAENLIKLNWGKAAKTMFSLKHRKLALLEAEMNSPGAEIAYIYKVKRRFDDPS